MRLCKAVSLVPRVVTSAALAFAIPTLATFATVAPAQALAAPGADRQPTCAGSGSREFPVRTRIHGGPDTYGAGGGYRTWYLDLTNTTDDVCGNIHPVVVLVDEKRALKPAQARLEFYEGEATGDGEGVGKGEGEGAGKRERPHPVRFQRTSEAENVGVFDDGFPGFTVAPGAKVSVTVRLAIAADAVPNDVVANAAVVQRHDDDGDWVGASNDYRFRIVAGGAPEAQSTPEAQRTPEGGITPGAETTPEAQANPEGEPTPEAEGTAEGEPTTEAEGTPESAHSAVPFAEEMAGTGMNSPRRLLGAAAGAFLLIGAGVGVLLVARRRR
ncbi:hypothetical protein [Streptomyces sporangiiformans]|uniref:Gram-positive cocci surface proteins LPxTG domain-containing protein n=1 Tax=Streptomyces sporangiiformans TaxID=2315329 RepID=A0A505DGY8_9ACTN|nr:hypothetical protein [Streptomyces sporangiiformans]TPQ18406.1 hypothetical protein FGD71_031140 [Streptomyces sporangiiformans]